MKTMVTFVTFWYNAVTCTKVSTRTTLFPNSIYSNESV